MQHSIARIDACIVFKNLLLGVVCNVFDFKYHNLHLNRNSRVTFFNARAKLRCGSIFGIEYEIGLITKVLACLSKCTNTAMSSQVVGVAVNMLKEKKQHTIKK